METNVALLSISGAHVPQGTHGLATRDGEAYRCDLDGIKVTVPGDLLRIVAEPPPSTELTDEDIRFIMRLYLDYSIREIALRTDWSKSTIGRVLHAESSSR